MATDDPPEPSSVLILGGSLAGLMHALTLLSLPDDRRPSTVTILERSPTALLHNQGAGVVAGNEVQQFFDDYVKPGREIAVPSPTRQYLSQNGAVIPASVEHRTQRMTSWDLLYRLLRWRVEGLESPYTAHLSQAEKEANAACPKAEYVNGCTVTAISPRGEAGGVEVTYTHSPSQTQCTRTADLVIAADGGSSTARSLLLPAEDSQRTYAGYVALRGTVGESDLSRAAQETLLDKFTFYHAPGVQVLGYVIPGPETGTLERGRRLFNWVWYRNYGDGSAELEALMTDAGGKRHGITLPVGGMRGEVWEGQKRDAGAMLPPPFAEAVGKTAQPFVQAVTDNIAPRSEFLGGGVVLVGDALAGFRPHTAASTGQAAFDAMALGRWMRGEIGRGEYAGQVMEFARRVQRRGVELGERSQFGAHPFDGAGK